MNRNTTIVRENGLMVRVKSSETANQVSQVHEVRCPACERWLNIFPGEAKSTVEAHLSIAGEAMVDATTRQSHKLYFHRKKRRGDSIAGQVPD